MKRTVLNKGQRLWAQGEPAVTVAVIDTGKIGIWDGNHLLGLAFPKMVVGEAALLPAPHAPAQRTASIFAVEDGTTITEYPPGLVKESFGAGVPRLVLRMLCGQICRNALLTLAADRSPVMEATLLPMIDGARKSEKLGREIKDWDAFMIAFRTLYHVRDASQHIRDKLCHDGTEEECAATVVRASGIMKDVFKLDDIAPLVGEFLDAERLRRATTLVDPRILS
jgi:hypothetical protein